MLLSIIIPTYNRRDYLDFTLSLFLDQVERNKENAEIVVANNNSTDGTVDMLSQKYADKSYIRVVNYDEHVYVSDNVNRASICAEGKYLIIWGDDDIPNPFLVDTLLYEFGRYPDIGCIIYSRLEGFSTSVYPITNLFCYEKNFARLETLYNSSEFAEKHLEESAFFSVVVIEKDAFIEGLSVYDKRNFGFEYMPQIFYGIKKKQCLYIAFPLCIQRRPTQIGGYTYSSRWPLYAYIGMPRVYKAIGEMGLLKDWRKSYCEYRGNMDDDVFYKCINECNYTLLSPYLEELCSYQSNPHRIKHIKRVLSSSKFERTIYRVIRKIKSGGIWYIVNLIPRLISKLFNKYAH